MMDDPKLSKVIRKQGAGKKEIYLSGQEEDTEEVDVSEEDEDTKEYLRKDGWNPDEQDLPDCPYV